ncbi:cupin domain-containing protein [Flavitalea sp. BT771]|uniref:cupin domain-containing protein n=1 Tax=Flavitalea sp. BT771 TaxID=3063329 RepID=UPI0026E366CE|nr:cupin domain-containing protein [Flavitalea sp. BT771]MDO6431148.1 cupin domain-containing protein [Flavitalea sp. BT771]MDV6220055.1 cupin domain-containing protein [Flavitalea sp. BT771]
MPTIHLQQRSNPFVRLIATALSLIPAIAYAQAPAATQPITRIDLQRHDLSITGWETVQVRVDFAPGATAAKHRHPGEEIIYVLEGSLEYEVEGRPAVTLHPGQVLFIPSGTPHSAKNTGKSKASELATYVVEKGKPLLEVVAP